MPSIGAKSKMVRKNTSKKKRKMKRGRKRKSSPILKEFIVFCGHIVIAQTITQINIKSNRDKCFKR